MYISDPLENYLKVPEYNSTIPIMLWTSRIRNLRKWMLLTYSCSLSAIILELITQCV